MTEAQWLIREAKKSVMWPDEQNHIEEAVDLKTKKWPWWEHHKEQLELLEAGNLCIGMVSD